MPGGGQYIGARPAADGAIADKKHVDDRWLAQWLPPGQSPPADLTTLATAYATRQSQAQAASTAANSAPMVAQSYVDAQDALRASKAAVDAGDALRVPKTARGVAGGIATIDAVGYIPSAQLPVLTTERVAQAHTATTVKLTQQDVTSTNTKAYEAASLSIPDPGYPYFALPFAQVLGRCTAQTHGPRRTGGGSYGKLAVLTQGDAVLAGGMTGGQFDWAWAHAVPYAAANSVPANTTVLSGATTLTLWLALWSGTSYTFTSTGFSFWALVVPAL